ncbi:MAG: hypothetical protein QG623_122 [Patescibacteria group bacterium]|nr:hypothetical protein [Patescibacteria group bacterium]
MIGGNKKKNAASATAPKVDLSGVNAHQNDLAAGTQFNQPIISGPENKPPQTKAIAKRVGLILVVVLILSGLGTVIYSAFFKKDPAPPPPPPPPKPVLTSIEIKGDQELKSLKYGDDYTVQVANSSYLVQVIRPPKRLFYNGKEVYRGEDLTSAVLSSDGKHWALQTNRQEQRSKRDENTKILQNTMVDVSTFLVDGQKWGERDVARLVDITNSGEPNFIQRTGKQTPSQYGLPLEEEVIYSGESKKFETSYGILSYQMSDDGSDWLATTANPSTKDVFDFFVNGVKKDSLDARIIKKISIDEDGNYLLGFCQQNADFGGVGLIGKDCQISVNGKTRTTIAGTVYLADVLGAKETYAGIDRELRQSFSKNSRLDLILEHRKDMEEDIATVLGIYLNQSGDKYALTTSRMVETTKNDGTKEVAYRLYLSINSEFIENDVDSPSLIKFGSGEEDETLFIYEIPKPDPVVTPVAPTPAS